MSPRSRSRFILAAAAVTLLAACSASGEDASSSTPATEASADMGMGTMPAVDENDLDDKHDHDHGATSAGTSPTAEGFTITPLTMAFDSAYVGEFAFNVITEDTQEVVTDFEVHHEKSMHLLLVNHELTEYMHLHPEIDANGVWRTPVTFPADGFWRVVADFVADGKAVILGTDVVVGSAPMKMSNLTTESRSAVSGPYTAEISGDTAHEGSRPLKVRFTRDGEAVSAVNPYLGANAHLVAFSPSLAYTHVHPNDGFVDGTMTFTAPALDHSFYKLFLQVDFDGELRLFEFVIEGK